MKTIKRLVVDFLWLFIIILFFVGGGWGFSYLFDYSFLQGQISMIQAFLGVVLYRHLKREYRDAK